MLGKEAERHAVEEPAPPFGTFDPEPIHGGHEPKHAGDAPQGRLWIGFFVYPDLTGGAGFRQEIDLMRALRPVDQA